MIDNIKKSLKSSLNKFFVDKYQTEVLLDVEEPKNLTLGDISVPLFPALKALHKGPNELVPVVVEFINSLDLPINNVTSVGAFINMFVDK